MIIPDLSAHGELNRTRPHKGLMPGWAFYRGEGTGYVNTEANWRAQAGLVLRHADSSQAPDKTRPVTLMLDYERSPWTPTSAAIMAECAQGWAWVLDEARKLGWTDVRMGIWLGIHDWEVAWCWHGGQPRYDWRVTFAPPLWAGRWFPLIVSVRPHPHAPLHRQMAMAVRTLRDRNPTAEVWACIHPLDGEPRASDPDYEQMSSALDAANDLDVDRVLIRTEPSTWPTCETADWLRAAAEWRE